MGVEGDEAGIKDGEQKTRSSVNTTKRVDARGRIHIESYFVSQCLAAKLIPIRGVAGRTPSFADL